MLKQCKTFFYRFYFELVLQNTYRDSLQDTNMDEMTFRVSFTILVLIISIFVNYFIYRYKIDKYNSNDEIEAVNLPGRVESRDTERTNINENSYFENDRPVKVFKAISSLEMSKQVRLEDLSKTQENVLSEIEMLKTQVKQLQLKQNVQICNTSEQNELEDVVEALRKDVYNRLENINVRIDELLTLGDRTYPNTIDKNHAALICLAVFPFILYWVCYTHCKITELQKLEHAQTSQMSKFNSELDALRKELETLKQLTTNDGESNEVSGRKSI
ncbi:uncharacterized protein LOC132726323 isoform X1 [Ruditapes philippinarum]|uniref:uncharacterized protein LOC132726323 isoform X1 n=1 Tax=Ruditapes philippinarum TaxID=129788 RepID=UPI00295C3196|nr:uncharacterized protein LOC132726323 isoform X1 [Ruditapes philippinarum]